jgi:hypothetical protein
MNQPSLMCKVNGCRQLYRDIIYELDIVDRNPVLQIHFQITFDKRLNFLIHIVAIIELTQ